MIEDLPDAASQLVPGRVYAVVAGDRRLARQLARAIVADAGRCALAIADANTAAYLHEPALLQQWEAGDLPVFNLQLSDRPATRLRVERLTEEFDHYHLGRRGLLVIDPADGLLDMGDADHLDAQLGAYRQWAHRHGCALLLFLDDVTREPAKLHALMSCADDFAGIARLATREGATHWSPMHWFSELGMHGSGSYRLEHGAGGRWRCVDAEQLQLTSGDEHLSSVPAALDDGLVYCTRAAVADSTGLPDNWQVYDDIAGLRAASHEAINGTLIIHYDRSTAFEALAREVHAIRQHHGRTAKLLVREIGVTMRHYQEKLLLRIGANRVVPAAVGFSRFVGIPEQMHGQVFSGELSESYEEAVASLLPPVEPGYHPVPDFIRAVAGMQHDSQALELQSALIRLNPLPGITVVDALALCRLKRHGDIVTADRSSLYLHLFACREVDVPVALAHVFELPVSAVFVDQVRYSDVAAIEKLLDQLQQGYAAGEMEDLSESLAARGTEEPAAPTATAPAAAVFQPREVADAQPVTLPLHSPAGTGR